MPKICAVLDCRNRSDWRKESDDGPRLLFHRFPHHDKERLGVWIQRLHLMGIPNQSDVVCSNHFATDSYHERFGRKLLKGDAVPVNRHQATDIPLRDIQNLKSLKRGAEQGDDGCNRIKYQKIDQSNIYYDHRYCKQYVTSDDEIKRLNGKIHDMQKRITTLKKQVRRREQKCKSIQEALENLQKQNLLSLENVNFLKTQISDLQLELITGAKYDEFNVEYSNEVKQFALYLYFCSTKAYEYVRQHFKLPHVSSIRRWLSKVDCSPGFTSESFLALRSKCQESSEPIVVSLMLDDMAIRQQAEYDGKQFIGYVDVGQGNVSSEGKKLASKCLVIMVVAVNGRWKIPIGYFAHDGLDANTQAKLVKEALIKLSETGVKVVALIGDGLGVNISMAQILGANLNCSAAATTMKTWFPHPVDNSQKVWFLIDACHVLKMIRNFFDSKKILIDGLTNETIEWKFIEQIDTVQKAEGLHAANKLRQKHVKFHRQKMNVSIAAQTLSSSVADAMVFLKKLNTESFQGCEPTAKFIRCVDRLFDIMNSRNVFGKGYKKPMTLSNQHVWRSYFKEATEYLSHLKLNDGTFLLNSRTKTGLLGMLVNMQSLEGIFDTCINCPSPCLKYLLTYKLSQDHLELYFSTIRSRGGHNNNPSVQQFRRAYRQTLASHIKSSATGNVFSQDDTISLTIDGTSNPNSRDGGNENITAIPTTDINLSLFSENVVTYIAGFTTRKVCEKIRCNSCQSALVTDPLEHSYCYPSPEYLLIGSKTNGGLIFPSKDVVQVCRVAEGVFRGVNRQQTPSSAPKLHMMMLNQVLLIINEQHPQIFAKLASHQFDSDVEDVNHISKLIKELASTYLRTRAFFLGKCFTEYHKGESIRHSSNKLVQFKGQ